MRRSQKLPAILPLWSRSRRALWPRRALVAPLLCVLTLAACTGYGKPSQPSTELSFGVDMARRGLWNEALFRFREAEKADPENPRVQNNLGVAYEAQGDFESALAHYKRALQLAPENKEVRANYARFVEFYQAYKAPEKKGGKQEGKGYLPIPKMPPPAGEKAPPPGTDDRGKQPPPSVPPPGKPEGSNAPPGSPPPVPNVAPAPGVGAQPSPPPDQPPPPAAPTRFQGV